MIGKLLRAALFRFRPSLSRACAGISAIARKPSPSWVAAFMRRRTPRRSPMRWFVATNGIITAIGGRSDVQIPQDASVIDCTGKTIVAGFWNSHVHFTEGVWRMCAQRSSGGAHRTYAGDADQMGALPPFGTLAPTRATRFPLRQRVNSGEILGPQYPVCRQHFSRRAGIPPICRPELQLPEAATADEASQMSRSYFGMGLDGIKLFTGVYMGEEKPVVNMDVAIAKARGRRCPCAGQNRYSPIRKTGRALETVITAGVDVVWRTSFPASRGMRPSRLARFQGAEHRIDPDAFAVCEKPSAGPAVGCAARRVRRQTAQGVFRITAASFCSGTDVGFITIYDTSVRIRTDAPRTFGKKQILASLTTNPALYFKAAKKGRVEKGF